jgi:cell division protease FtsH
MPHVDPVHKVSILPRGMALGYTMTLPVEDKYLTSKSELLDQITFALGGRAAEELVFDEVTTGAENDLNRATDTARRMVCEFGMSEKLGPLTLGRRHGNPFLGRDLMEDRNYSEEVASAIDQEVRRIIDECYDRARNILIANRARMRHVVEVLLEKETIETDEFIRLMEEPVPEPAGKVTDHEEDATVVADDTAVPAGAAGASRQD